MPLVTVKVIEGVFSASQKQEIARKLTETLVAIEGEPLRPYTVVIVDEVKSGDWCVGGQGMTAETVKWMRAVAGTSASRLKVPA